MQCPNDNENLEKALFHNVEVDYCPKCLGTWFDKDELKIAGDNADERFNWLDVDLWRDKGRFNIIRIRKFCPVCRVGLVEVNYDGTKTKVDFCRKCEGIWLDRGEFKQIINYLKNKFDYGVLHHYAENFVLQLWRDFSRPEVFREDLEDFLMLLKLFNYKFIVQHPHLTMLIEELPK